MAGFTDDYGNAAQAVLGRSAGGLAAGLNRPTPALEEATKRLHEIAARLAETSNGLRHEMDRINGPRPETGMKDPGSSTSDSFSAVSGLMDVISIVARVAGELQSEAERAQSI
jgi:hypothetical protein